MLQRCRERAPMPREPRNQQRRQRHEEDQIKHEDRLTNRRQAPEPMRIDAQDQSESARAHR